VRPCWQDHFGRTSTSRNQYSARDRQADQVPLVRMVAEVKFANDRPFADPEAAARKLLEIANAFPTVHDGRIYIEKINGPMLYEFRATPAEYRAGLTLAIERGWLIIHESGTYVKFTQAGAELFA
jgi:hypothetical protein